MWSTSGGSDTISPNAWVSPPTFDRIGYHIREVRVVSERGDRVAGFGTRVFGELTGRRYVTLGRSDLSRLIFEKARTMSEAMFGDQIVRLDERPDGVQVQFERSAARKFDLVIGADGLHSPVRRLAFGAQDRFEKTLGYRVAAFETRGYRPRDEQVYGLYCAPGRMLGRFALHDDRTLFLFVFAADSRPFPATLDLTAQKAILCREFTEAGWETPRILDAQGRPGPLLRPREPDQDESVVARARHTRG